ncbi:hypothetical protein BS78_10G193100 [Paspalum vaginatum]|nr:hypothetical protein BS78_10G193100 [Paspalum vaginatum]
MQICVTRALAVHPSSPAPRPVAWRPVVAAFSLLHEDGWQPNQLQTQPVDHLPAQLLSVLLVTMSAHRRWRRRSASSTLQDASVPYSSN